MCIYICIVPCYADPKHSVDENRLIAVTARYMHGKEIAAYEKAAYENDSPAPEKR